MAEVGPVLVLVALAGSVVGQDLSSCCANLRVESTGQATVHQSNRLGNYSLIGRYNDRGIYKNEQREEFLFYLTSRNRGLWMVGPEVGQFNGGLANRGDQVTRVFQVLGMIYCTGVCGGHSSRSVEVHRRQLLEAGRHSDHCMCSAGSTGVSVQRPDRLRGRRPPRGAGRRRT